MEEKATFVVQPIDRFAGKSAAIKRPKEFAHFSFDENHELHLDNRSLKYYYPANLNANLNDGFNTFRYFDELGRPDKHLDSLLFAIADHEQKTGVKSEADFIMWRGMMTRFMAAPFDRFNSFELNATLYQGTIFVEEDHATNLQQKREQERRPPRPGAPPAEVFQYYGYKFETLSVLPDHWDNCTRDQIEGRETEVVNNAAQYCSIVKTGIGSSSMVLGGEVDAIWDAKPDDPEAPINWVELKTNEQPQSDADLLKYERKLLKHWAQSFLLGVPKIIVGFRSRDGILLRHEEMDTNAIPGTVKRMGKQSWDGNTCINFVAAFLEFLKNTITGDGTWRISRKERSATIEVYRLTDHGHSNIVSEDFARHRQQMQAREIAGMLK